MLVLLFTVIYFLAFHIVISLVFNNFFGTGAETSLLTILCWIIAFFASVGLAEHTSKKIKENLKK